MSVKGVSPGPGKMYKIPSWRNNSGELDVFEATQYFSGANDNPIPGQIISGEKTIMQENMQKFQRKTRMSLDLPIIRNNPTLINSPQYNTIDHPKQTKDKNKFKQPSSPGARLASFLNSLLNQTPLKKKISKPVNTKIFDENEEENPNGRRRRRNSISHIFISSSNPGFENPNPGFAKTPTKSCKEIKNLCDPKKMSNLLPEKSGNFKPTIQNGIFCEKNGKDYAWIEEKSMLKNGVLEKISSKNGSFGFSSEEREFRKFSDDDSDSSSDLFDLPNHELDFNYSSDLPVYETTHLEKIEIGN